MNTAMILAAGRGERLRPLTNSLPKAMCLVNDAPLIEHHVVNLKNAGYEHLVINHAYLGGKIRNHLGNGSRWGVEISYSPEPPGGLETGGGIVKALPLLGEMPFITVNADIFTDFDFSKMQTPMTNDIHLILVNKNPALAHHGDFGLKSVRQVTNENPQYTFAGIAGYHPRIFSQCSQGRYSVTPLIRDYARQNKVSGELHQGAWFDIGSLERLQAVNQL